MFPTTPQSLLTAVVFLVGSTMTMMLCSAHVPYIESSDWSSSSPFVLTDIANSKALYGYLNSASDVDVMQFEIKTSTRIYASMLVPVCKAYSTFSPWYALIGPGLSKTTSNNSSTPLGLPVTVSNGYGAIIVSNNLTAGSKRKEMYEPVGGKSYYVNGPKLDQIIETKGTYQFIIWDPINKQKGDYVFSVGYEEKQSFQDFVQVMKTLPMIRRNRELHVKCTS